MRLVMAILFLTTASFGTVVNASAHCVDTPSVPVGHDAGHGGHDHGTATADGHSHGQAAQAPAKPAPDAETDAVIAACHANAGCPSCTVSSGISLASTNATKIAFWHPAIEGNSTEPDRYLRPPKFS